MRTQQDLLRTQALDLLRFPLAIVILSIHIILSIENDISYLEQSVGGDFVISNSLLRFVRAFFVNQSVPIYFFISGFVFFLGLKTWNKEKYINKLKNRKNSLLIPYIIWNSLSLAISLIAILLIPSAMTAQGGEFTLKSLLSIYWQYDGILTGAIPTNKPINYPLWFVRDLMIIVLLAPMLYYALKKFGKSLILLFAILWVTLRIIHIEIIPSADGLLFFSFGAYMSIKGKDMIAQFGKYKWLTAVSFIMLGIIHFILQGYDISVQYTRIIKMLMIFTGLFFAYNTAVWLITSRKVKVNKFLASSSFFIYISHALICSKVLLVCKKVLVPTTDLILVICYLLSVVFSIVILLAAFYLMSKFTPKLLTVIAGRKG